MKLWTPDSVGRLAKLAQARQIDEFRSWIILLVLFVFALSVRAIFATQLDLVPFAPFFVTVLIATIVCGWRKALIFLLASTGASWLLFEIKPVSVAMTPPFDVRVAAFLIGSGFAMALIEGLVQAVQRVDAVARLNQDLFRELQHRVSNNFQIVAATLQKARRGIADKAALEAIDTALSRIHSLAQLHRRLYDPDSYKKGLAPILREALAETFHGVAVDLKIDVDAEALTINEMTSLVLLINEAAINASKHVFQLDRGKSFVVSLKREGAKRVLTINDDGPGFETSTQDAGKSHYGLAVMRGLAAQLGGHLEITDRPGAMIRVAF